MQFSIQTLVGRKLYLYKTLFVPTCVSPVCLKLLHSQAFNGCLQDATFIFRIGSCNRSVVKLYCHVFNGFCCCLKLLFYVVQIVIIGKKKKKKIFSDGRTCKTGTGLLFCFILKKDIHPGHFQHV